MVATSAAVALYVLHNIFYASFSCVSGFLADRLPKNRVLAGGYALAALMVLGIMFLPAGIGPLALVFVLGGIQVAVEETLEDAFCAELIEPAQHGMAFGILASVNGIGDFLSSAVVGLLWSALGQTVAFGYSAVLFLFGAALTLQVHPPMSSSRSQPGKFRNIFENILDRRGILTPGVSWSYRSSNASKYKASRRRRSLSVVTRKVSSTSTDERRKAEPLRQVFCPRSRHIEYVLKQGSERSRCCSVGGRCIRQGCGTDTVRGRRGDVSPPAP